VQEIQPKLVLDAGCGAGHTTMAIAPHSEKVIAFDLTESMLEQVQQLAQERNFTNIETGQGNVAELPFEDETFDVVVSRYSAHHWSNPEKAVKEFFRVLKNGGQFILSDIVAFPDPTCDTFLQAVELLRDTSHVRDYSIWQWHNMLQDVGLTCEVYFIWKLDLEFEAWVTRMSTPEQNIQMIQTLFDGAPQEVRQAFNVQEDYSFHIPGALLVAKKD
jgi:ubiquinone/menaquinone biosynthesis C-methylase UbiE